ncbi:MAG: transporter [Planctomycetes bacterium]|nr:transporter [Planctomycetota bacterium]
MKFLQSYGIIVYLIRRKMSFSKDYFKMYIIRPAKKNKLIFAFLCLVKPTVISWFLLLVLATGLVSTDAMAMEHHTDSRDVFGSDLTRGWFDEPVHGHFSPLGTPLIHPFRVEPAFTNRDLLVNYTYSRRSDEDEGEFETELEWTLTRRIGLLIEIPYAFIDPKEGSSVNGIGDMAIGTRVLLAEYERALLAFGLEIETPTGDIDKGLGRGETAIAPSISSWLDMENRWTGHIQLGSEHEVSSSENELFYRAALVHNLTSDDYNDRDHDEHMHGLPPGLLSLILEIDGTVDIAAEDSGHVETEGIFGIHYIISEQADLRLGYVFPFSKSQELNGGLTCGLIWHF